MSLVKQIYLITQEGCGGCAEAKRKYPHLPVLGIGVDARATRIADCLGLEYVPALVEVDGSKVCLLDDSLRKTKCVQT